jgi:hypothetical protein
MTKCTVCKKDMGEQAYYVEFCSLKCLDTHLRDMRTQLISNVKPQTTKER